MATFSQIKSAGMTRVKRTQLRKVAPMTHTKDLKGRKLTAKAVPSPKLAPARSKVVVAAAAPVAQPAPAPPPVDSVEDLDTQSWVNRRASAQATRAANARQVSGRRRFVDPTTCEREYTVAEMEFMQAMHKYKQSSGRMFPTWSEVLEVIKALGYAKPMKGSGHALVAAGSETA